MKLVVRKIIILSLILELVLSPITVKRIIDEDYWDIKTERKLNEE